MNNRPVETGDVQIISLDLVKLDKSATFPFMAQVAALSFWEHINSAVIYGEVKVTDGLNVLKDFPIVGAEYIDLQFQTPGVSQVYKVKLYVYSVTDIRINAQNNNQTYTLKCCSQEFIKDSSMIVSKGYTTTIDAMIGDLLTNYLATTKSYISIPTKGIQHIIIPSLTPLQAIKMLKSRAASVTRLSSSYKFFENRDGFQFVTLEDLIANGLTSQIKTYHKYVALRSEYQNPLGHWAIMDWLCNQQFNIVDGLKTGAYNGQLWTFDMDNKMTTKTTFDGSQYSQFISPDSNNPNNVLVIGQAGTPVPKATSGEVRSIPKITYQIYGQTVATNFGHITDSAPQGSQNKNESFIPDFLPKRLGFTAPFLTSSYDLYINGDTSLTTGDLINVTILDPDKLTDHKLGIEDTLTNGAYLVIGMRHNILVSIKGSKYTAIITVSKGTYK
jgi:hypothetical protein